ncbi:hypothetical protein F5X68DRAFT_213193 [Plectosphaerella plurivora]|uniref:Uncharacterized protein n=1 Tax=Plectosphaerella plurivora TaxID=936078 RepID=A0A9P8V3N2_9PEZI|nr:hypothetical protein F5X68DRAFT_213193 [Plectosphaerella plurivora]
MTSSTPLCCSRHISWSGLHTQVSLMGRHVPDPTVQQLKLAAVYAQPHSHQSSPSTDPTSRTTSHRSNSVPGCTLPASCCIDTSTSDPEKSTSHAFLNLTMSVAAQTQRPRRPPTSVTLLDSRSSAAVGLDSPDAPALRGAYVDTVVRVSDTISSTSDVGSLVNLLAIAYDVQSPGPMADDPLNTLMRTLSADRLADVTTSDFPRGFSRDEVVDSFARYLSPVLNGLTGLVSFEQAVDASRDPFAFRRFWKLNSRNLLAEATAETATAPATIPVSFVDTFVSHPDAKKLALTKERGLLALVPCDVEPGDEVWTVSQLSRPVLVRRTAGAAGGDGKGSDGRQTCQVLGEAYVHGLCDSEPPSGKGERYKDVDLPLSSLAVGLAGSIPT